MKTYTEFPDVALIKHLKEGDNDAFTEIYERYWEFLYQSSYKILKDPDLCDDLVQEVFVWLWINRKKHLTDALKPYLYAAVKYKVFNAIRHGKVKEAFFERAVVSYKETVTEPDTMELRELKEIIAKFTQSLPERAGQIFHLSRNEFLTNKEIAEKLGISEKTVENQMNISLKKLRVSLGKMSFWCTFL